MTCVLSRDLLEIRAYNRVLERVVTAEPDPLHADRARSSIPEAAAGQPYPEGAPKMAMRPAPAYRNPFVECNRLAVLYRVRLIHSENGGQQRRRAANKETTPFLAFPPHTTEGRRRIWCYTAEPMMRLGGLRETALNMTAPESGRAGHRPGGIKPC